MVAAYVVCECGRREPCRRIGAPCVYPSSRNTATLGDVTAYECGYARGIEAASCEVDSATEITMSQPTRNAAEARTKMEVMALLSAVRLSIRSLIKPASTGGE